jgi:hypothetical protein
MVRHPSSDMGPLQGQALRRDRTRGDRASERLWVPRQNKHCGTTHFRTENSNYSRQKTRSPRGLNGYGITVVVSRGRYIECLQDRSHGDENRVVGQIPPCTDPILGASGVRQFVTRSLDKLYRRPNPNWAMGDLTSGLRNRSGSNSFVLGPYTFSSCRIVLEGYTPREKPASPRPYKHDTPYVSNNDASSRYKIIPVYVVLHNTVRDSKRYYRVPSENFRAQRIDVWKALAILKDGEAVHTNHRIKLSLSLLLGLRVENHGEHEGGQGRDGLWQ